MFQHSGITYFYLSKRSEEPPSTRTNTRHRAPPVLIRRVSFFPSWSRRYCKGLQKSSPLSINHSARLNEALYAMHLCVACALTVCLLNKCWCISCGYAPATTHNTRGAATRVGQHTNNACICSKRQTLMFEDTREENVGNFPIFNFGGTHESAERKKKNNNKKKQRCTRGFRNKQCIIHAGERELCQRAGAGWLEKPAEGEEREWERRLWGGEKTDRQTGREEREFTQSHGSEAELWKNIEGEGAVWGGLPPQRGNTTQRNVLRESTLSWRETLNHTHRKFSATSISLH